MSKAEWVQCPNGCGEKLYYREVTAHCQTSCQERLEPCSSGCGAMVRFRERNKHKMVYCGCRIVSCKFAPPAGKCRWTGQARYLTVHLDDTLTTKQKEQAVKGDPYIECLERPTVCWHPPLVAVGSGPEDSEQYRTRWVGCGEVLRFGDRDVHEARECPFRQEECKLGCGEVLLGFRVAEHYAGRRTDRCLDSAMWVGSGCPERDMECHYPLSKRREAKLAERPGDGAAPAAGREKRGVRGNAAGGDRAHPGTRPAGCTVAVRRKTEKVRGKSDDLKLGGRGTAEESTKKVDSSEEAKAGEGDAVKREEKRALSPMSTFAPEERAQQQRMAEEYRIRFEEGCGRKMKARDLLRHQAVDCKERFILCKHGCGEMVKSKDQYSHEDERHSVQNDLHLAAGDGNLERVKDHVIGRDAVRKLDINSRDEEGSNALHYAAEGRHTQVVKMLLHHAADPNVAGKGGLTPLMCATLAEEKEIIELLLDAKANPDALLLCRSRADPSQRDNRRGDTPLHLALIAGDTAIAEMLVNANADLNLRNKRRVNTFYHTFSKTSGKPREVKRGDVPQDLARSEEMRRQTKPDLDRELVEINAKQTLDPLYGHTFETSKSRREMSPAKKRALGIDDRSLSPSKMRWSSKSPTKTRGPEGGDANIVHVA